MITTEDFVDIKNLKIKGLTNTAIAEQLGVTRKTIYNNLKQNKTPKYIRKLKKNSKLKNYIEYIESRLEKHNLTSWKLFEEIKKQGYTGGYGIVNNLVKKHKKVLRKKAYIRFETLPGEQAQVDWGYMGQIYDNQLKKNIKVYCFVIVLGYSRTVYIDFFSDMKIQNFLIGHNNAFKYFEGYTKDILYDNLKSVVIKRKLKTKDSEFNKKFMDFAGHYGFKPILARPYRPETKGKVEKMVDYVKRNFYAGEEFKSLIDIINRSKDWLKKVNNRIHQTIKEIPFDRLKKENLISLENKKFYDTSISYFRKVQKDVHFSFKGNFYSVPIKYVNKEVTILEKSNNVFEVFYQNKLIATHYLSLISSGIYITKKEHLDELEKHKFCYPISKPLPKKTHQNTEKNDLSLNNYDEFDSKVQQKSLSDYDKMAV
jgi:transposase